MGLFNRNKNEDTENEMLVILGEIRDNLKINNDENLTKLESKIADAKYSNDEEIGVISTKIGKLEKLVELQDQTINRLQQRQDKYDEIIKMIMELVQKQSETEPPSKPQKPSELNVETNDNKTKSYKDLFIEKYEGWTGRPYTNKGVKYNGFEFRVNGGANSNTYVCNILQLKELNDNLDEILKYIYENNDFTGICEKTGIPDHVNNLFIKRILFTLINKEPVFMNPLS